MRLSNHRHASAWKRIGRVVLVGSIVITGLLIWQMHSNHLLSVQTNSMAPSFIRGDAIVVEPVMLRSLRVGDVVSYRSSVNPAVIITHRVIYINTTLGSVVTKGDNTTRSDGVIAISQIVGRSTYTIARLGYILNFLRSKIGLVAMTYVPAISILTSELRQLFRSYSGPTYQLRRRYLKAGVLR